MRSNRKLLQHKSRQHLRTSSPFPSGLTSITSRCATLGMEDPSSTKYSLEKIGRQCSKMIPLNTRRQTDPCQWCSISQPLEWPAHSHSYQHVLETFYLALQDADEQLKTPHHIAQYMDCEAAIKSPAQISYKDKPDHSMLTDFDRIKHLHCLKVLSHT